MVQKLDYKQAYKELYQPAREPGLVTVPEILFLAVDGRGDPNQEGGAYQQALEALYALTFTVKMSKMGGRAPEGYFEYTVPPLEGLWWLADDADRGFFANKERYFWTSMIRQPEFVTEDVLCWAKEEVQKKKPHLDISKARLLSFAEGLCVQVLHLGPYDAEPETLARMNAYVKENGLENDIGAPLPGGMRRRHHEIYLGDPRKSSPEKLKTVLRHPVKRRGEQL